MEGGAGCIGRTAWHSGLSTGGAPSTTLPTLDHPPSPSPPSPPCVATSTPPTLLTHPSAHGTAFLSSRLPPGGASATLASSASYAHLIGQPAAAPATAAASVSAALASAARPPRREGGAGAPLTGSAAALHVEKSEAVPLPPPPAPLGPAS